jgi:hypothetical protein
LCASQCHAFVADVAQTQERFAEMSSLYFLALSLAALILIVAIAARSNFHRVRVIFGIYKIRASVEFLRSADKGPTV